MAAPFILTRRYEQEGIRQATGMVNKRIGGGVGGGSRCVSNYLDIKRDVYPHTPLSSSGGGSRSGGGGGGSGGGAGGGKSASIVLTESSFDEEVLYLTVAHSAN